MGQHAAVQRDCGCKDHAGGAEDPGSHDLLSRPPEKKLGYEPRLFLQRAKHRGSRVLLRAYLQGKRRPQRRRPQRLQDGLHRNLRQLVR